MTKDLSILEKQNADKFNNVQYLHGFRFGVLEGYDEGYQQGRTDAITRDYNTILIYEDTIRSMLLNTSQENNLIEWVDLNGKLNAITHIKHLIYD